MRIRRKPHYHNFEMTSAKQHTLVGNSSPVTVILYTCACGEVKTSRVEGHWTMQELQGRKDA